jgi:hypothetical protein
MHRRARALLQADATPDAGLREYLFAAALLGAYAAGRPQDAMQLWNDYSGKLFKTAGDIPLYLRIIVAAADDPGIK